MFGCLGCNAKVESVLRRVLFTSSRSWLWEMNLCHPYPSEPLSLLTDLLFPGYRRVTVRWFSSFSWFSSLCRMDRRLSNLIQNKMRRLIRPNSQTMILLWMSGSILVRMYLDIFWNVSRETIQTIYVCLIIRRNSQQIQNVVHCICIRFNRTYT